MTGIINFETFLLAGILLNLTPGNDTIFILSRSIAQGKQAGIMSVLGIATGSVIHTTLAAFGLSIIIAKSIIAFNISCYRGRPAATGVNIPNNSTGSYSKSATTENRSRSPASIA